MKSVFYSLKVPSLPLQGISKHQASTGIVFVCFLLRFFKAKLNSKFTELEDEVNAGGTAQATRPVCDGSDDNDDCVDRTIMMCYDDGSQ